MSESVGGLVLIVDMIRRWLEQTPQSNNGLHPTRDTLPVIKRILVGGRVMPGVSLLRYGRQITVD